MIRSTSNSRRSGFIRRAVVSPVLAVGVWTLAALVVGREIILPTPFQTAAELVTIVARPDFFLIVATTLTRVVYAFAAAVVAAVFLGIGAGLSPSLEDVLSQPTNAVRAVPTMGIILLSLIWLDSEGAPILVSALVAFPIMYSATVSAVRSVNRELIEMQNVFRVPQARRLIRFYAPAIFPEVRAGMVAALGLSTKVMIAAEVLSQPRIGVGTMLQIERARINTAGVLAWSVIVVVMAAGLDYVLTSDRIWGKRSRVLGS